MWHAHIITQNPALFPAFLAENLAGRALKAGYWGFSTTNLFDFGTGAHKQIDDTPAGGGAGMVLRAEVAAQAVEQARQQHPDLPLLWLSPAGAPLTQARVQRLAKGAGAMLFCSRFEGVDARAIDALGGEEVSLGDYVVSGGETAALVLLDAVIRLLPNVIGKAESAEKESFNDGLLEHAHYTAPASWRGRDIPPVLLSGHHENIARHRAQDSQARTRARRPDLWQAHQKNKKDNS